MDNADKVLSKLSKIITDIDTAVISNPARKKQPLSKVKLKKAAVKKQVVYQFQYYIDTKVTHKNVKPCDVLKEIIQCMIDEGFRQCSIQGNYNLTLLMNKHNCFKITGVKENVDYTAPTTSDGLEHNKRKNYILKQGEPIDWMVALGLMDSDGSVISHKQKKFRQINRFLEMLDDVEKYLTDNCTIVDMGCGKSYLTFAMYHYLNEIKRKNVTIMGFDLKKDVVEECNRLSSKFGFKNLQFYNKDIAEIDNIDNKIGMVITLHACNTATDIAMYHGIRWNCRVIMSVPCCQHQLFPQVKNDGLSAVMDYGILKERFSALLTDGIRAKILEIMGYKTNVMEFIDMEHTPKNIMIRAVKTSNAIDTNKKKQLEEMLAEYSVKEQCLYDLCFNQKSVAE